MALVQQMFTAAPAPLVPVSVSRIVCVGEGFLSLFVARATSQLQTEHRAGRVRARSWFLLNKSLVLLKSMCILLLTPRDEVCPQLTA